MKPKTTLILLLFLIPAVIALILTSQGADLVEGEESPVDERVTIVDADQLGPKLTSITFDGGLDLPLTLERIAGQWLVTSPHRFPAKTSKIDELLSIVGDLRGEPTEQNFGPYPDQGGIRLRTNDKDIWLAIGERLGSGKAGIALITDGQAQQFIVDDALHELYDEVFERDGRHAYYAKKIRPLLMPEYQRIEIATVESESVLRQTEGQWMIGEGEAAERALEQQLGEHPGVADYFKLIEAVEVIDFVPYYSTDDLANFGINRPVATVRFVPRDADQVKSDSGMTLRVGVPADLADQTRYVSFGQTDDPYPLVFTTQSAIALAFAQGNSAFRDPRILRQPISLIKSIEIRLPEGRRCRIAFKRGLPPTLIEGNGETTLYPGKISTALRAMSDARASDYLPVKLLEWDLLANVTLAQQFDGTDERFAIFQDPDSTTENSTVLIHRERESVVLRVQKQAVAWLLDPMTLIRSDSE